MRSGYISRRSEGRFGRKFSEFIASAVALKEVDSVAAVNQKRGLDKKAAFCTAALLTPTQAN